MAFGFGIGKNKVFVYSVDEFSAQVNGIVDPKLALKQSQHIQQAVELSSSGWSGSQGAYSQTVNVEGVTSDNTIIVSAHPDWFYQYGDAQIYAASQGDGTITFFAKYMPTGALVANIVILGV